MASSTPRKAHLAGAGLVITLALGGAACGGADTSTAGAGGSPNAAQAAPTTTTAPADAGTGSPASALRATLTDQLTSLAGCAGPAGSASSAAVPGSAPPAGGDQPAGGVPEVGPGTGDRLVISTFQFRPNPLRAQAARPITVEKPGTYQVHCELHPGMEATVEVS